MALGFPEIERSRSAWKSVELGSSRLSVGSVLVVFRRSSCLTAKPRKVLAVCEEAQGQLLDDRDADEADDQ